MANRVANVANCRRRVVKNESAPTSDRADLICAMSMKAPSISRLFLVGNTLMSSPNKRAATCASFIVISETSALTGFTRTAIVVTAGTSSWRSPNRFATKSTDNR